MTQKTRRAVRAGLVYLTVSFLVVGLWATLDPRGFYDGFPGGGRRWVAGDGAYNAHLVGDAGVGFLAVGVVLLLAAIWMDARLIQAAAVAAAVHAAPHLLFHLRHPNDSLGSVDTWLSNGGLAFGVLVALVVLVVVSRSHDKAAARTGVNRSRPSNPQLQTPAKERTS
jgi:hypothetical protein